MDLRRRTRHTARTPRSHPSPGRSNGDGQPELGLHPHPRGLEESGPSRRAFDGRAHPEDGGHSAQPRARHDLADLLAVLLAADFFTTEVWTPRGLLTYCTAFVIELHLRRVHVLGSTTHPDSAFVLQAFRGLASDSHVLRAGRLLICDRDPKWSDAVEELLRSVGVRVVRTPASAPNCMPMRSASSGRSRRNASTVSCRWVNATFGTLCESSPTTIVRTEPSGHRERTDRAAAQSTDGWSRAPSSASRRHP